jgi:phosphoesterase RecJ-like protein
MTETLPYAEATRILLNAESILLVTHFNPDGDAIGSLLGLGNALRALGKRVDCAVDKELPEYLRFLPGAETVLPKLTAGSWSVMVSLDSSDEERSGDVGAYGRAHSSFVINVDHHPTNTRFGHLHLIKPQAVSTTEIVLEWVQQMQIPITREIAVPLLTGLVTDTIGFSTSNVTAYSLAQAQILMEAGASLTEITQRTLNSMPYRTVELWKQALQTVTLQDGVISALIRREVWESLGLTEPSDDGLVSWLCTANEAMVSVTFRETSDGAVNLSFRCKPGYNVASVAFALGGGGHTQASGATVKGTLDDVYARVMPMLKDAVRSGELVIS